MLEKNVVLGILTFLLFKLVWTELGIQKIRPLTEIRYVTQPNTPIITLKSINVQKYIYIFFGELVECAYTCTATDIFVDRWLYQHLLAMRGRRIYTLALRRWSRDKISYSTHKLIKCQTLALTHFQNYFKHVQKTPMHIQQQQQQQQHIHEHTHTPTHNSHRWGISGRTLFEFCATKLFVVT